LINVKNQTLIVHKKKIVPMKCFNCYENNQFSLFGSINKISFTFKEKNFKKIEN